MGQAGWLQVRFGSQGERGMTKHPGKTAAQRRVLDEIGCGNYSPIMSNKTRDAMLAAGLIVELSPRFVGDGPFAVRIRQFEMPISVHMDWCTSVSDEEA